METRLVGHFNLLVFAGKPCSEDDNIHDVSSKVVGVSTLNYNLIYDCILFLKIAQPRLNSGIYQAKGVLLGLGFARNGVLDDGFHCRGQVWVLAIFNDFEYPVKPTVIPR